jgi:hypothetical protein
VASTTVLLLPEFLETDLVEDDAVVFSFNTFRSSFVHHVRGPYFRDVDRLTEQLLREMTAMPLREPVR